MLKTEKVNVVDEVECREGKFAVESGMFLAAKNNALFDGRFVCRQKENCVVIFWQDKHSEVDTKSDTVSATEIGSWHADAFCATALWRTAGHVVVLLYVTNRRLFGTLNVELECLAVVSRDQLRSYLSPTFAGRGLFAEDA